jgi:hypothetical protein
MVGCSSHTGDGTHSNGGSPKQKADTACAAERPHAAVNALACLPSRLWHTLNAVQAVGPCKHKHTGITIKTIETNTARVEVRLPATVALMQARMHGPNTRLRMTTGH